MSNQVTSTHAALSQLFDLLVDEWEDLIIGRDCQNLSRCQKVRRTRLRSLAAHADDRHALNRSLFWIQMIALANILWHGHHLFVFFEDC